MKIPNFVIPFLTWNEKTNFKTFFIFSILIQNQFQKNKNLNCRMHFLIWVQKMNSRKLFHFQIVVMKLENEKWKFVLFLNQKTNSTLGVLMKTVRVTNGQINCFRFSIFENWIFPNFQLNSIFSNFQKLPITKNCINFQFTLTSPKFKN